jgi:hypothetical protein
VKLSSFLTANRTLTLAFVATTSSAALLLLLLLLPPPPPPLLLLLLLLLVLLLLLLLPLPLPAAGNADGGASVKRIPSPPPTLFK